MKPKDYQILANLFFEKCQKILNKKSVDYARLEDVFSNIKSVEAYGIDPKIGLITRMSDKLNRIATSIERDYKVENEGLYDTLIDLANYCCLFAAFVKEDIEKDIVHDDWITDMA